MKGAKANNLLSFSGVSASLFALALLFSSGGHAQDSENQETPVPRGEEGQLVVPIYPGATKTETPVSVESLKDNYIVLEDGRVITLADWVLGSLQKSNVGAGMSDYQNRMFLGQVARAAAGLPQDLVYRSFRDAGPRRSFIPDAPSETLQAAQGILAMVIPGLAPNWSPIAPDPGLSDWANRGNGGAILFDEQFQEALFQSSEDFIYQGRMSNMLKEQEAEAEKP